MLPSKLAVGVVVWAALGALPALGQSQSLSLADLLAEVEAANPTLRAARLDADALATRSAQVSLPDPLVEVMTAPAPLLGGDGTRHVQGRIEQMVPWPGTLALRRDAADGAADIARAEADVLAADLALEVTQAYVRLHRVQRLEALVEAFRERLGAYAEAAAVRYEVGRGPQGAILTAQVERGRLEERLRALDVQRRSAVEALARLTDRPGLALDSVALEPPPVPAPDSTLIALARQARPEFRALDAAEARADTETALARRAFFPDLGFSAAYTLRERGDPAMEGDALALGVMVRVPLWRGALRARVEEARLREAQVEARRDALDAEIATRIAEIAYTIEQERATLDLYRTRLIPQAEGATESLLNAYTTGQADFLALLDAERTLFALRTETEEARARLLLATAALERAAGGPPSETTDE